MEKLPKWICFQSGLYKVFVSPPAPVAGQKYKRSSLDQARVSALFQHSVGSQMSLGASSKVLRAVDGLCYFYL